MMSHKVSAFTALFNHPLLVIRHPLTFLVSVIIEWDVRRCLKKDRTWTLHRISRLQDPDTRQGLFDYVAELEAKARTNDSET
jgi:hypothetical protein